MRLVSDHARKSFISYVVFEHFLTTTLIGVGVPACIFFGIFFLGRRNDGLRDDLWSAFFSDQGRPLMGLAAVLAVLINLLLVRIRRMDYVVGVQLDDARRMVVLDVRGLAAGHLRRKEIAYDRFSWTPYRTITVPGMAGYSGFAFCDDGKPAGHFLVDHFTWDAQARNVRVLLKELDTRIPKTGAPT